MAEYQKALEIDPNQAAVRANLGGAYLQKGGLQAAIRENLIALELNPNFALAHNNLGVALAEQGRFKEAVARFTEALRINPNFEEAQRNLELSQGRIKKSSTRSEGKVK